MSQNSRTSGVSGDNAGSSGVLGFDKERLKKKYKIGRMRPELVALLGRFRRLCIGLLNLVSSSAVSFVRFAKRLEIDYTWWAAGIQGAFVLACYIGLFYYTPPPGLAIGVLGIAAAFMTLRADHFTKTEKMTWIIIAFALFFIETRSVYRDQHNHQVEFETTVQNMKVLWSEATGGNSYMYFDIGFIAGPTAIDIPEVKKGAMIVTTRLEFVGAYPLRDVKLRVFGTLGHHVENFDYGNVFPPQLGSVQASPDLTFSPDETQHFFYIFVEASNGSYEEMVLVHKVGNTWLWACNLSKATGGLIHPSVVQLRTWAAPGFPAQYIPAGWPRPR